MKIIAFYLPQFHSIPENDEWWEPGFTEWTNVKKAKPLFEGHQQPQIPLNYNYYNLLDDEVKIWQAKLAKEYGIYGFCYYHYWFDGKLLLEKPMEQMLRNPQIDIPFCICWANEAWTKIWVGNEKKVLYPQKYGNQEEWIKHFEYFLPFFRDSRYIQIDGKPAVFLYKPEIIPCLNDMIDTWQKCAKEYGFKGLTVLGKYYKDYSEPSKLDYLVEWQPSCVKKEVINKKGFLSIIKKIRRKILDELTKISGIDMYQYSLLTIIKDAKEAKEDDYDSVWEKIINSKPACGKSIPGAFVRWDNTPRFGEKGTVIKGDTAEKFQKYLGKLICHAKEDYKTDLIFLFAWNEWAEGGFLEPDVKNKYSYLEAVKMALKENDEDI